MTTRHATVLTDIAGMDYRMPCGCTYHVDTDGWTLCNKVKRCHLTKPRRAR